MMGEVVLWEACIPLNDEDATLHEVRSKLLTVMEGRSLLGEDLSDKLLYIDISKSDLDERSTTFVDMD